MVNHDSKYRRRQFLLSLATLELLSKFNNLQHGETCYTALKKSLFEHVFVMRSAKLVNWQLVKRGFRDV